jgi:broad specificity phosphatase PhoE
MDMRKKKPTTIYLVRHGEVHNPERIVYGRIPGFRLSETGRQQATKLGKFLSKRPIAGMYASPLDRTRETASIVASFLSSPIPVSYDERLLEVKTPLEGTPLVNYESHGSQHFDFYSAEILAQGGESIQDIANRIENVIEEITEKHSGSEVVMVSHGDPIMIIRAKYQGKPLVLGSIRDGTYVQHAKGIQLIQKEETTTVLDLKF